VIILIGVLEIHDRCADNLTHSFSGKLGPGTEKDTVRGAVADKGKL
jgi:hypothetical protein